MGVLWRVITLWKRQFLWAPSRICPIALLIVRDIVLYLTLVINVISLISLVVGVLLHSGQGGGLSDMFGGASSAGIGSAAAEKNLNRITAVFATVWIFTVVALGFLLAQ